MVKNLNADTIGQKITSRKAQLLVIKLDQMITLLAHDLQWITGVADNPQDQCAHGAVEFSVNNTMFVKPEDGIWTVSAAGLYLLRTLSHNHVSTDSVAESNFLFPHCGHAVWLVGAKSKVLCMGCNIGIDIDITHDNGIVTFHSSAGTESATINEWQIAVLNFAKQICSFYQQYSPKEYIPDKHDREGWAGFWQEWKERVYAVS